MTDKPFTPSHYDALFACEALKRGQVCTVIEERFETVTEEILWSQTAPAVRVWAWSPQLEARLLAGLGAAASMALVDLTLLPVTGRWPTQIVRWQLRTAATANRTPAAESSRRRPFSAPGGAAIDLDRHMLQRRNRA